MEIRTLTTDNTGAFCALRLSGLRECPRAFGESAEEFAALDPAEIQRRIGSNDVRDGRFILGAFEGSQLVGITGVNRSPHRKQLHSLYIWGVYVSPAARSKGVGRMLVSTALEHAEKVPDANQIKLTVESGNTAAKSLYERLGFRPYGVEPRAIKVDETFFDEILMMRRLGSAHETREGDGRS